MTDNDDPWEVEHTKARRHSDAELVSMCLAGDPDAWEALLRRYVRLCYAIALGFGLSEEDAADVFQLVSMSLLDHLQDIRDASRLPGWIATVTRRHAAHVRSRKRRIAQGEQPLPADGSDEGDLQEIPDMDRMVIALRDQQLVQEAMELLPPRCRQLLTLLFGSDGPKSYAEIARQMQMSIGSVGPTRSRCLARLKRILMDLGF